MLFLKFACSDVNFREQLAEFIVVEHLCFSFGEKLIFEDFC